MSAVVVRDASPDEVGEALVVWRRASSARHGGRAVPAAAEAEVRTALDPPGAFLLVARDAAQFVGLGLPGVTGVAMIYVAPERSGQGVGKQLVAGVLAAARLRARSRGPASIMCGHSASTRALVAGAATTRR